MSESISAAEQNRATVRAFNDRVFGDHDVSAIDEFVTEDFVQYDARREYRGIDETRAYFDGMLAMFPDVELTVHELLADDDRVLYRAELSGTNEGDIVTADGATIPATGRSAVWGAMVSTLLEDGKMAETRVIAEDRSLYEQLGILGHLAA